MNLKKIYDADEERRTRSGSRKKESTEKKSSLDLNNINMETINSTIKYYVEKYPYFKAFGDFEDFENIQNIWYESLSREIQDVPADTFNLLCYPKFTKATMSQFFSGLYDSFIQVLKNKKGYLSSAPLKLSFRFGKENQIDNVFVKVPMACNLDSNNFTSVFQDYYNSAPEEEKTDIKGKMEKVSSWVQPVLFEYMTTTSKKDKKNLKKAVKKVFEENGVKPPTIIFDGNAQVRNYHFYYTKFFIAAQKWNSLVTGPSTLLGHYKGLTQEILKQRKEPKKSYPYNTIKDLLDALENDITVIRELKDVEDVLQDYEPHNDTVGDHTRSVVAEMKEQDYYKNASDEKKNILLNPGMR